MAGKTGTVTTVAAIDDDLRAACADRDNAWRRLMVKDTQHNRDAYAAATEQVDGLLDMRHGMAGA